MRGVDLTWAGGEHTFLLTIDLLRALQDKCDAGPQFILERLSSRRWFVNDVTETIRLGLEGGGTPKEEARKLVRRYVEDRPLTESVMTAMAVLTVALFGHADDMPGERKAGMENKIQTRSREENGASPASTHGAALSTETSER
ncbi:gene transfer agent family protein [Neorhizobium sp. Rsf11]|uniref:Gene transfer agent family protein n=1 Tax=Neorhizobium phenanthreniclasticum TaxID=3157917 RepID=A0ABV0LWK7_9HYPH